MENKLISQEEFIALFPHARFRYIHDEHKNTIQGDGKLDLSWNQKGYGIFFSVNGFPFTGKADESQLISLNCNYIDFDVDPNLSQEQKDNLIQEALMSGLEMGIPTPTIINRTQKGIHGFWLYPEILNPTQENIKKWREVQRRLVYYFKGDKNAVDPTRVLRVPYTLHLKDPKNPFEIKIASYKAEMRYSLNELDEKVPKYSENETEKTNIPAIGLLLKGVPVGKGERHGALMQIAGLLLMGANTPEKVAIARQNYYDWDQKIVGSPESLGERKKELDNIFEGILKKELLTKNTNPRTPSKPKIWTVGEILEHDFGEEEWLIESLIPKQGITAISGNPGDYKTWTTIHKALCVSRGNLVFDRFKVTQGSVLIIDEEDHIRLLKKRLELLGAKETDNIYYISQNGIKVDVPEVRDEILAIVKEKNIKLLILDSLVRVHEQDENDAKGMAKVFSSLQKIIGAGASILFTHHHRKQQGFGKMNPGQSMRGSSDILAAVDCHITIEKKQDEDRLVIKQTKLRQGELLLPFEISILKSDSGPSGFEYAGEYDEKKKKAGEVAEAISLILKDGMKCRTDIHEFFDEEFGKSAIDLGIKIAEENGSIQRVPKEEIPKEERKKAYYQLPASLPYIEEEKQEDEEDLVYTGRLSNCCQGRIFGDQCEVCGADGTQ